MKKYIFFTSFSICSILFLSFLARTEEATSLDAPMEIYLVEKTGDGNYDNTISSIKMKNLFLRYFRLDGFHVFADQEPPFVSKSMERYELIHGGRNPSSGIGYVHLLLADTNVEHYFSDSGQEIILKLEPKSVAWLFDKKKALSMADKAGAKYAFVINITTQRIYQNDSPEPVYNIILAADLFQADTGSLVFSKSESMVKLASSAEEATWGASQFLSRKIAEETQILHTQ
jgi:hypothetical protein